MSWKAGGLVVLVSLVAAAPAAQAAPPPGVTRVTLENGLRVVVVPDPLAPAATVELNYLAGATETPPGFPGLAHALEHMAFRGCAGLSADQTAAIFADLGGAGNADTQQSITQYFTTVPADAVGVALHVLAACMQHVQNAPGQWAEERGAIEQEVARDFSDPTYTLLTRLNGTLFTGTPYAHDALGTRPSFDATTATMLRTFNRRWYAPNNAILVVTGDVHASDVLAQVRTLFGSISRRQVPGRPVIALAPVHPGHIALESNLPYALAIVAWRLPGTDSPDFAATEVLADVLASHRGSLYAIVPDGLALDADFTLAETYPKASLGLGIAAVPTGQDASAIVDRMRRILADDLKAGLPVDLIDAAKRGEVARAAFARDSIPGLADAWSNALAARGLDSPAEAVAAIRAVTADQVNRVARLALGSDRAITATLVPKPSGAPVASTGFGGGEQTTAAPTRPVTLPAWAADVLRTPTVPHPATTWTDTTLPNGLRLIVVPQPISPTVTLVGHIRHDSGIQAPAGKAGVSDILGGLFPYGTTTRDRVAFQKALDDIAAEESAGYDFSLRVLKGDFSRGVELLADNELHPALPAPAFDVVKRQTLDFVRGRQSSPAYHASQALLAGLLPKHDPALRRATPETIEAITRADVVTFHRSTFRPDLTTIVVIGDVTPPEATATIDRWFGDWTATGPAPDVTLPPVPPNASSTVRVPDRSSVQTSVTLSEELGLTPFSPDYYMLQVGDHVLGGGFYATRLYRDLRERTGYVYAVSNRLDATRTRTVYTVAYGCDPQNVAPARDLIERDLESMQQAPVTPEELQQAKALLLRQIPLRESSESSVAHGLAARAELGLPLDEPTKAAERYAGATAADVQAAFRRWIRPEDFVAIIRQPAAARPDGGPARSGD